MHPVFNVHIKDSIIQRSDLLSFCDIDGTCGGNVVIDNSVVTRSKMASGNEELMEKQREKEEEEQERLRREEAGRKEREETERKAREENIKDVWDSLKQLVNIKTIQYVKTGQKEIEKSGFLGRGWLLPCLSGWKLVLLRQVLQISFSLLLRPRRSLRRPRLLFDGWTRKN